jgi:hypothetical protein
MKFRILTDGKSWWWEGKSGWWIFSMWHRSMRSFWTKKEAEESAKAFFEYKTRKPVVVGYITHQ